MSEDALSDAIKDGDLATVKTLLDKGANPNAAPNKGRVPILQSAAHYGYYDIVKLLLERGADVNARAGVDNATALHSASGSGSYHNTSHSKSPSANSVEFFGRRREVVKLLLANGADVNVKDAKGWTPLYMATYFDEGHNRREIIELLRQHGGHE